MRLLMLVAALLLPATVQAAGFPATVDGWTIAAKGRWCSAINVEIAQGRLGPGRATRIRGRHVAVPYLRHDGIEAQAAGMVGSNAVGLASVAICQQACPQVRRRNVSEIGLRLRVAEAFEVKKEISLSTKNFFGN